MDTIIPVVAVVISAITCFLGGLKFLNYRFDRRFELIKAALDKQDEHLRQEIAQRHAIDARVQVIETKVAMLPNGDRVDQLFDAMGKMTARIAVVEVSSKATADGVKRIEDYLLHKGKT